MPPTIKAISVIDENNLNITFSESIDENSASSVQNYSLSSAFGNPKSVVCNENSCRLTFQNSLISERYWLMINNVKDKKGNAIAPNSSISFFYIKPYLANYGDVVINEIFANPTGSPGLPQKEFIELWNTSNEYILTQGWKYTNQTSVYTFLSDTIKPKEYVVLCAKIDTNQFKPFGKTIGISPWPSLNNDKDMRTLINNTGKIIDKVAYYDTCYKDDLKKKGGFSLELIDPRNLCKGSQNWLAALDKSGGTPGKENSVYRTQLSTEIPKIINAIAVDSVTMQLDFSKTLDSLSAVQTQNYIVNNGIGSPYEVIISPQFSSITLKFGNSLARGVTNTVEVKNVTDCAGNQLASSANHATLFIAKKILKNDILISEVLFNPKPNGVDFVEIYNNTNQPLDLKDLQIANLDSKGAIANVKSISTKSLLLNAKTYWVICSNTSNVKQNYFTRNPDNFTQISTLPAYNNDKGSVILLSNNQVIDQLNYDVKIHHPLIKNEDGISIERVSFLVDTNEPNNFKSAAATVGFATPSYKNSQELSGNENFVSLRTKTLSPDGDGFEDVLIMDYQFTENSSQATISVYSDKGILIRELLKNQTIATAGNIIWDGLANDGNIAKIGIYVIVFDVFDLKGNTKRFKIFV